MMVDIVEGEGAGEGTVVRKEAMLRIATFTDLLCKPNFITMYGATRGTASSFMQLQKDLSAGNAAPP